MRTLGLIAGHDEHLVRGVVASGTFSVLYLRSGRLRAVDTINATRDFAQAKSLIRDAAMLDPVRAVEPALDLKDAAVSAATQ